MSKKIFALALLGSIVLVGNAFAIEPIKGSLTYDDGSGRLPYQNMLLVPGQVFLHTFQNEYTGAQTAVERYRVNADGTLTLLSRRSIDSDRPESEPEPEPEPEEKEPPINECENCET